MTLVGASEIRPASPVETSFSCCAGFAYAVAVTLPPGALIVAWSSSAMPAACSVTWDFG